MNILRINQLKSFLSSDPNDPFVLHALGLEFKTSEPETSERYFTDAIKSDPDYVGTYYHLAEVQVDLDKIDAAKATYEAGMKIAQQLDDRHALRELKNAYQNFLIEFD